MNLSKRLRSRRQKKGSILIIAVGMMIFIVSLFFVVSSYESQMLQNAQLKLSAKNASLAESSITQAIRAAAYMQYMSNLISGGTPTQYSTTDFDAIISQAGTLLGVSGLTSGTVTSLPADSGGTVTFSITKPAGGYPYTMAAGTIAGTGSWLDNTPATLVSLPFALNINATAIFGGKGGGHYTATPTRSVLMCQVSPTALAAEAESDLTLGAGVAITGNVRVAGTLTGSSGTVSGSVAAGTIGSGNGITSGGQNLNRGISGTGVNGAGYTFQAYNEIQEVGSANQVKQSSLQRVDSLSRAIPTDFLYREGLVGSTYIAGDANTTSLYQKSQPYYGVPTSNRLYGTYSLSGANGTFTPIAGSGVNTNISTYPPTWANGSGVSGSPANALRTIGGTNKMVMFINLQDFLSAAATGTTATSNIKLFVGGTDGTTPDNCFTNMVVAISSLPQIQTSGGIVPRSLTIISPNQVVFRGNLNTISPIPLTVISQQSAFGLTGGGTASFVGQMQGGSQLNSTATLTGADGVTNTGTVSLGATVPNAAAVANDSTGQSLFIALITQQ